MNIKRTTLISGLVVLGAWAAQAATLVEYDISSRPDHKNRYSPSIEDSNLSASKLTADGTVFAYSSKWSVDSLAVKAKVATIDQAEAMAEGTYMSFELKARSGRTLTLDSLSFGAYPGGGTPRAFSVYSSVDNYKSALLNVEYNEASTSVTPYQIDLSHRDGFKKLSTVEFRVYVQADAVNKSINVSGIIVEGSVQK